MTMPLEEVSTIVIEIASCTGGCDKRVTVGGSLPGKVGVSLLNPKRGESLLLVSLLAVAGVCNRLQLVSGGSLVV